MQNLITLFYLQSRNESSIVIPSLSRNIFKSKFAFFLIVSLTFACNPSTEKDQNGVAVARANSEYLYLDDVKDIVPKGTPTKDSSELIQKYIDNWIRETLVTQKAESNLGDEQKNVEKQLKDYRNSLITYTYEKELVKQKLDTIVSETEIAEYYNNNQADFELKDNIIKVLYIKVDKKAPGIDKLKRMYKSDIPNDRELLASYCHQFASNFYLDDSSWLLFDDLLKEIPIQTYNKELFLQNNRFVEVSDSLNHYFVNIKGFKIRNSLSPLGFEKENIKNIILNKRKLSLITKMIEDIYNDAANNNNIEIYTDGKLKK